MKKKIAHRDLKLANILINDQYQLKLADFGLSKDMQDGWMRSFCGSPVTMAPEVLKREKYN
jgi:serine/threonine-protein kinase ULK/ATG1